MLARRNSLLTYSLLVFLAVCGSRGLASSYTELPVTFSAWREGTLQRAVEQRVGVAVAIGTPLGQAYSQLLWSVLHTTPAKREIVVGQNRQLYEALSVKEYCHEWRTLETSDAEIARFASQAAMLARHFHQLGRAFIIVATPSKAAAQSEYLPRLLCAGGEAPNRVSPRLSAALRETGVSFVDGARLAREPALRRVAPVFAHYGIHWTRWGAFSTTAALLKTGAERLGDPKPRLELENLDFQTESVESAKERAMLLDLFWGTREERIPIVRAALTPPGGTGRRATLVGGSFLQAMIAILRSVRAYASIEEFNYLTIYHASYPSGSRRENLALDDIDWARDVFASDVIVLEMNEENGLADHARIFVSEALRRLTGTVPQGAPVSSTTIHKPHVVDP